MTTRTVSKGGIPVSLSLTPTLEAEDMQPRPAENKRRLLYIAILAVIVAVCISGIARLLVSLIDLATNISFYGRFSVVHSSPANNHLGPWVIAIPIAGGVIVGLMALYGSKAIRGHGIPEAMEQILTNQSKIKPTITYLKPLSSAIAIGTGGPFGAEGPIIATGGALGSTLGQLTKISHNERKILLAAGATAGMSAIFGSPIAAIFLAIELLLFEFSPRAIIPVALACITGAAGHYFFFSAGPVFPMTATVSSPSDAALAACSVIGILIGLLSVGVTKIVYAIEDLFEKLPLHWMWWPAMGGVAVGIIGYFAPHTLGVGYENITNTLSGTTPMKIVLSLCLLKFLSWAIALGSGTSGGTLAPLLTIGGATGALLGSLIIYLFPQAGLTLPLAALVGMSAMFAGASRALLTSIIFALETTGQSGALLPLLASCTGSFLVSFFLMENTIMTEKIARRGVKTPDSYEPDVLEKVTAGQVIKVDEPVLSEEVTVEEVREWLKKEKDYSRNYFIIVSPSNEFSGIVSSSHLFSSLQPPSTPVGSLVKRRDVSVGVNDSLRRAVEMMAREGIDVLPVLSESNTIAGVLSYRDIISAYKKSVDDQLEKNPSISLKRHTLRILVHGQRLITAVRRRD